VMTAIVAGITGVLDLFVPNSEHWCCADCSLKRLRWFRAVSSASASERKVRFEDEVKTSSSS
jgi:hypothetical protein